MTFEVPVARVGRRSRSWPIAALVVGLAGVALIGFAGGPTGTPTPGPAAAAPLGSGSAAAPVAPGPFVIAGERVAAGRAIERRPLPDVLRCEGVDEAACARIARAALLVLPADVPTVTDATVWRSLRCGDTSDCPPHYLKGAEPLGSVFVGFADGSPGAVINVVDWRYGSAIRLGPRAWLVDWLVESG